MRDNNNSEYRPVRMSRTSQAVVLENVVALQIRYHISKSLGLEIIRDDLLRDGAILIEDELP
jgi:hypothetical protein